jgi:hypothetical protein
VTFHLALAPQISLTQNVDLCVGESFTVNGTTYTSDTVFTIAVPAATGCDTIVMYVLAFNPLPTRTETIALCQGDFFTVEGVAYTADTTVTATVAASAGCDTVVTYALSFAPLPTRTETIALEGGETVTLGGTTYTAPDTVALIVPATSPGCDTLVTYVLLETACDVKTIGCMRYELLTIRLDADGNRTYRIRGTNYCSNKLVYTAIQVPQGTVAVAPANGSTYTAPSGRTYTVRNPNFTPVYSIRFKSQGPGISHGQSEIFEYTVDEIADMTFIYIFSRLSPDATIAQEAHLNTFYCPILPYEPTALKQRSAGFERATPPAVEVYPNPAQTVLYVDLPAMDAADVRIRLLDVTGRTVLDRFVAYDGEPIALTLPASLPNGLYTLQLDTPDRPRATARIVVQH